MGSVITGALALALVVLLLVNNLAWDRSEADLCESLRRVWKAPHPKEGAK